jgi:hypothetical protein
VPNQDPVDWSEETVARAVTVLGLLGVAIVHLIDSVGTYSETRYIFWLYMALIVACVVLAAVLLFGRRASPQFVWSAVFVIALAPLAGFILSRSVGLPADGGDIGNWTEPLGLVSMFVETLLALLAAARATVVWALPRGGA